MSEAHIQEGQTLHSGTWCSSVPSSWLASWWKLLADPRELRLLWAPSRGWERQLHPVQERNPQQLRVQRPRRPRCTVPCEQEHRDAWAAECWGPSGGRLPLPGDVSHQLGPHPLRGCILLPQASQQAAQGLLWKKQSSRSTAWRSRRDDSPTSVLSAEAALRPA
ncbi:uncharacterized protein C1orf159 homolog isoform X4 [Muntiacus reevesi]|uniref:uncharacterized protein C1orf159 homolog isoform X4 n=1 Tax=Muntiacus reevesi TaxID=9886 RepID=UPI003306C8C1